MDKDGQEQRSSRGGFVKRGFVGPILMMTPDVGDPGTSWGLAIECVSPLPDSVVEPLNGLSGATTVHPSAEVRTEGDNAGQTRSERLRRLRACPSEWHRRGLLSPDEISRMVARRLLPQSVDHDEDDAAGDPTYADFFAAPE